MGANMKTPSRIRNASEFAAHLRELRAMRRQQKISVIAKGQKRRSLTKKQRGAIFLKTEGRCHICGGEICQGEAWQADHVLAHAQGGVHSAGNYLPAHPICNNYRWFYGSEEFQWILKLGVWMRTQIEKDNHNAIILAERFVKYETVRESRTRAYKRAL